MWRCEHQLKGMACTIYGLQGQPIIFSITRVRVSPPSGQGGGEGCE